MNSVKDLNFSKSYQHPSSALEADLETMLHHWFSKKCETFYWTNLVSFLKETPQQSKPDTENPRVNKCLVITQDAHIV